MKSFSFNFKGKNSRTDFGIMATSYDFIMPPKRERKRSIPFRDGSYDYGAEWYDDRTLRIRCLWISSMIDGMSRSDLREISYWLAGKGRLYFDIEPDKWYVGELYDPAELMMHYNNRIDGFTSDGEFELNFICEPFAYRTPDSMPIQTGTNAINYLGTADTPCSIVLRNNNNFTINNLQISVTRRIT